jgi:hypothetical protein
MFAYTRTHTHTHTLMSQMECQGFFCPQMLALARVQVPLGLPKGSFVRSRNDWAGHTAQRKKLHYYGGISDADVNPCSPAPPFGDIADPDGMAFTPMGQRPFSRALDTMLQVRYRRHTRRMQHYHDNRGVYSHDCAFKVTKKMHTGRHSNDNYVSCTNFVNTDGHPTAYVFSDSKSMSGFQDMFLFKDLTAQRYNYLRTKVRCCDVMM